MPMGHTLDVGDKLPDATLPDQDGKAVELRSLLGKGPIVLYFYPRDETPGCTAEACQFRDDYAAFTDVGATVVGVSSDTAASHKAFAANHRLPFTLLADERGTLRKQFGVTKQLFVVQGRVTFVIDKRGIIRHVFDSLLQAKRHVAEALVVVQRLAAHKD